MFIKIGQEGAKKAEILRVCEFVSRCCCSCSCSCCCGFQAFPNFARVSDSVVVVVVIEVVVLVVEVVVFVIVLIVVIVVVVVHPFLKIG